GQGRSSSRGLERLAQGHAQGPRRRPSDALHAAQRRRDRLRATAQRYPGGGRPRRRRPGGGRRRPQPPPLPAATPTRRASADDRGKKGEDTRRVWVAVSTDEGKTFAAEKPAYKEPTGACGCCGLRAFADSKGMVYALYRGAKTLDQRDMYLLTSADQGKSFG